MKNYNEIIAKIRIKSTDNYDKPIELMSIDETVIFTLGNLSVSSGKAKSKKTYNVSAIVAAYLSDKQILKYKRTSNRSKKSVLYIDTEQGYYHAQAVFRRILKLAGFDVTTDSDDLIYLCVREFSPIFRRKIIEECLATVNDIGLLVIDGVRDIMYDINDARESMEVVNILMQWSTRYNIHIHLVLHQNKNDEQLRGHIGTELVNKAETVLLLTRDTVNPNISRVKSLYVRGGDFASFTFKVNDESLPELITDNTNSPRKIGVKNLDDSIHLQALKCGIGTNKIRGYDNIIIRLQSGYSAVGYQRGRSTMNKLLKQLIEKKMLIMNGDVYLLNDKYM